MTETLKTTRPNDPSWPNPYVGRMTDEFGNWTIDEGRAPALIGRWREEVFGSEVSTPMDLEIGVGNGFFFAHRAYTEPGRLLLGLELKYKPIVQTVARTLRNGSKNARVVRYDAAYIEKLFSSEELNDVFIFFPDPWPKRRRSKHRIIQHDFLKTLFALQRPGAKVEIKTDSREYFDWMIERTAASSYRTTRISFDLHKSEWAAENFKTHFERLWTSQGFPTHYLRLEKI